MTNRTSGILMHITSLPGKFGIGTFGQSAYDFVDFLVETKQTYLADFTTNNHKLRRFSVPVFSAIAGNTHLIRLRPFGRRGVVGTEDFQDVNLGTILKK